MPPMRPLRLVTAQTACVLTVVLIVPNANGEWDQWSETWVTWN